MKRLPATTLPGRRRQVAALAAACWTGLAGAQLRLPETLQADATPTAQWQWVHQSPLLRIEVNRASLQVQSSRLAYQLRDGIGAPRWVAARCDQGLRAELPAAGPQGSSLSRLLDPDLPWRRPAHGSRAEADLLHACDTARQRNLAVDAVPEWPQEDWEAVYNAWRHTAAGTPSTDWRVAYFATEDQARRGRLERWGTGTHHLAPQRHASSQADVPLALRTALGNLTRPGERSPVLALKGVEGEPEWAILELVARGPLERPADRQAFMRQAAAWVGQGLLDGPAALRADPDHAARVAYLDATTAQAIKAVPPHLSPNVRLGSGLTPLTWALLSTDLDRLQALLDRGADPNLCGQLGCPLHLLGLKEDAATRATWLERLLQAGARPDAVDTTYRFASTTALGDAVLKGDMGTARRLRRAGAHPDGVPGVSATPLEMALETGQRAAAQWLVAEGASVLPWEDRSIQDPARGALGRGNPWLASRDHPDLQSWIEGLMMSAAAARPEHDIRLIVEQDGRRQPVQDGGVLTLRPAPFRLIFVMPGTHPRGVTLTASLSPSFAQAARRNHRGNGALIPSRSGALTEVDQPNAGALLLHDTPVGGTSRDQAVGGHVVLQADPSVRRDFHAQRGTEYIREVAHVTAVPEQGEPGPDRPITALKGQQLELVYGSTLVLDPIEWAPWVKVRALTLRFR
ncbi:hypothetical protein [Ideonella livida]|uniref:Uncharacterized protein n=1 Tax=Ideonella livida TaxID=2707176 RepID=A0A7C9PJ41_9BURK|nr:hypothetical protein [Ideonella livida]NDY93273.1 hypothetical protein [Ideonella livida]